MDLCIGGVWRSGVALYMLPGSPEYKACFEKIFNKTGFLAGILKIKDYSPEQGLTDAQMKTLVESTSGIVRFMPTEEDLAKPVITR